MLEEICAELGSNPIYINLSDRQKRQFVKGKEPDLWRWHPDSRKILSWQTIAIQQV